MMRDSFTFADLCAGVGGFHVALAKLGGNCIYSCDIDTECERTYFDNHGQMFDEYDIHTIEENRFPDVDIICAGFPCQPYSIAGGRLGFADERSDVFFKIASIIKTKEPRVLLLENVPNLLAIDSGRIFSSMKKHLENIGYKMFHSILDSADFGVPQSRPRLFMVLLRQDLVREQFQFTKSRTSRVGFRSFIIHNDFSIPISRKWQLYIDLYQGKRTESELGFEVPKTRKYLERIDAGADLADCVFQIRSSGIRALSIDKPLPTFAVSISGGGAMIPVYSRERRHLSLVEMKRIMGYPDDYIFNVSRTAAIKQLANSVCPQVVESIISDLLDYFF